MKDDNILEREQDLGGNRWHICFVANHSSVDLRYSCFFVTPLMMKDDDPGNGKRCISLLGRERGNEVNDSMNE